MNTELNAVRNFRADLAALKALMRWKNEDVARWLGCDPSTISKMDSDPRKTSGIYILKIQQRLREERHKQYEEYGGV